MTLQTELGIETDPIATEQWGAGPLRPTIPGSAAAALWATGIGGVAFGVAIVLCETDETIKTALTLSEGVGPLSGKAVVGIAVYLVSWALLTLLLRRRTIGVRPTIIVSTTLIVAALVLSFPPVFKAFAPDHPATPTPPNPTTEPASRRLRTPRRYPREIQALPRRRPSAGHSRLRRPRRHIRCRERRER